MATNITNSHAAVTVFVQGGGQADVAIDLDMKVHDAILYLIPYLQEAFKAHGRSTEELEDRTAKWQLVKGFNDTLDPSRTLGAEGVKSGNKLRLIKTMAKEKYPALIDDVPESIAQYQIERYKAWDNQSSKIAAGIILPLLALSMSIVSSFYTLKNEMSLAYHAIIGGVLIGIGLALCVLTMRIASKDNDNIQEASKPGSVAGFSGLSLLTGGVLSVIPATLSYWHVVAACIAVFALAMILKSTTRGIESVCYGFIMPAGALGIASTLSLILPQTSASQFGALGASTGMVFLMFASSMALRAANVPTPFVPTLGESYVNPNETADITLLPTSTSTEALQSIINREQQTVDAHNAILGMTAGGLVAMLIPLCTLAATMNIDNPMLLLVMVILLIVAMVFRAISYEDMMTQATWLSGITLVATLVPIVMVIFSDMPNYAMVIAGIGLAGAMLAGYLVTNPTKNTSPLVKHRFEILEFVCYVAVFVLLALVLDIYSIARFA